MPDGTFDQKVLRGLFVVLVVVLVFVIVIVVLSHRRTVSRGTPLISRDDSNSCPGNVMSIILIECPDGETMSGRQDNVRSNQGSTAISSIEKDKVGISMSRGLDAIDNQLSSLSTTGGYCGGGGGDGCCSS